MICKGRACTLHLTEEYVEGLHSSTSTNPYCFWDEYEKYYAFCIGNQRRVNQRGAETAC